MTLRNPPSDVTEISSGPIGVRRRDWTVVTITLILGAIVFAVAFRTELLRAVQVWDASTAYNHCFLILPISLYLIWERRDALLVQPPRPAIWPLWLMLPIGLVWVFAAKIDIMEGRQLVAMTLFQLFVLAVLGARTWRIIAFALLYLYFLVPFGAFLTPSMQDFAAAFAVKGLHLLGIPVYTDGYEIDVPGAKFIVAEACAGLRFLIASVALGTLYGYMMYRSWERRAVFILVSIVVPVIANGLRVLGIVVLGYWLSNAEAAVADHIIYGWLFFSIVSLILILLGLPFRQPMLAFPVEPVSGVPDGRQTSRLAAIGAGSAAFFLLLHTPLIVDGPVGNAIASVAAGLKHTVSR